MVSDWGFTKGFTNCFPSDDGWIQKAPKLASGVCVCVSEAGWVGWWVGVSVSLWKDARLSTKHTCQTRQPTVSCQIYECWNYLQNSNSSDKTLIKHIVKPWQKHCCHPMLNHRGSRPILKRPVVSPSHSEDQGNLAKHSSRFANARSIDWRSIKGWFPSLFRAKFCSRRETQSRREWMGMGQFTFRSPWSIPLVSQHCYGKWSVYRWIAV